MKTLLVMRHAKSDWSDGDLADFDRPLNPRGRADLPRVARFLARAAPPDLVLASAATRAHQTAAGIAEELGPSCQLLLDGQLYGADPPCLSRVLAGVDGRFCAVLVVAHNPGLEEWILHLTGARVRLPTAAVAHIESEGATWEEVARAGGRLQWLVTPKLMKDLA